MRVAWIGARVWAVLVVIGSVVVGIAVVTKGGPDAESIVLPFLASAYAALGLLIVIRQQGNNVAWLLFAVATWIVFQGGVELQIGDAVVPPDPVAIRDVLAIGWDNTGYFISMLIPLFLFFYIFPTGHFLSRRWSWGGWVAGVIVPVAILAEWFARDIGPSGAAWRIVNPLGFLNSGGLGDGLLGAIFGIGFAALGLGAIPAIIVRYRRADDVGRTQIKWVLYGLVVVAGSFLVSIFAGEVLPDWADTLLFFAALLAIPVGVTFAITRYRLYEIDKIISRTLSYALIVGLLGLVFATGVVWLPTALGLNDSPLLVAGTTLLVAAIFNPSRQRIQNVVDRRFNRSRYQAGLVEELFAARLQHATDIEQLADVWLETVDESLNPRASGIWLKS